MLSKLLNWLFGLVVAVWLNLVALRSQFLITRCPDHPITRWVTLTLFFLTAFAATTPAYGQGVLMQLPPITNSQGQPIPGATITVSTASGTLPTVTCGAPVTVYKDVGLTVPFTTLITDGFGNFPFYIAPAANPYGYTVTGAGTNTSICYGFSAMVPPASSPTFINLTATQVTAKDRINGVIYPQVVTDGVTDNATIINNAITAAVAANSKVVLPCGQIAVNSAINLTNINSGVVFEGCGSNQGGFGENVSDTNITEIICNTGTVCVDTTGSSNLVLRKFEIRGKSTAANPSTTGILMGRDNAGGGGSANKFCFAQFNWLDHVVVWMDANPTKNGGFGTFGVYNIGAEHLKISAGVIFGDFGAFFDSLNDASVASPYQTLATGCPASMAGVEIDSLTSIHAFNQVPIGFGNAQVLSFRMFAHYFCNGPGTVGVQFRGGQYANFDFGGQLENCTSAIATGGVVTNTFDKMNFHFLVNGTVTTGLFALTTGNTVTGSTFAISQVGGTPQNLFTSSGGTIKGSYINLSGLAGSGGSGITVTESMVDAPGLTDANVTFLAGSQYFLKTDTGISFVGPLNYKEGAAPSGVAGLDILWGDSGDHMLHQNLNNGGNQQVGQMAYVATTYTNATTTFSNVTGLTFTAAASRNYHAMCRITWQGSAGTTGPKYQFTGPATPTAVTVGMNSVVTSTSTIAASAVAFSSPVANTGTVTAATNFTDTVDLGLINGANAGAVQLQAAANGAGTLTIQPGSYCSVQ